MNGPSEAQDFTPTRRLRRLRRVEALRALSRETVLLAGQLVQPIFVVESESDAGDIDSLPGVRRHTLSELREHAVEIASAGVRGVLLFGLPARKDEAGSSAHEPDGIVPRAVERIKACAPRLAIMTDVCLCQYTSHGHCGLVDDHGIRNDDTLSVLAKVGVAHAAAGADLIAPSGMLDGTVGTLRTALDRAGHHETGILSYAVKYASALYGPFRDAVHSSPRSGDRASHQIDPANAREALAEARQDLEEGADSLMVKPAGWYLDVLRRLREALPEAVLAAYQVSGEHAMLSAAGARGWIDERRAVLESLLSIKRSGADFIITYSAVRAARWLREESGLKEASP